jgi:hypothetical protein
MVHQGRPVRESAGRHSCLAGLPPSHNLLTCSHVVVADDFLLQYHFMDVSAISTRREALSSSRLI